MAWRSSAARRKQWRSGAAYRSRAALNPRQASIGVKHRGIAHQTAARQRGVVIINNGT
jgi:hypothetical protein